MNCSFIKNTIKCWIVKGKHCFRPPDDSDNEKDERKFEHRKAKSMAKARGHCLPMNFTMDDAATGILKERARIGSSLADVDPMNIDSKVCLD